MTLRLKDKENTVYVSIETELKEDGEKSKHDNASSTKLMLCIPVITECFHAHMIKDTGSYPGDHHPDLICVYTVDNANRVC